MDAYRISAHFPSTQHHHLSKCFPHSSPPLARICACNLFRRGWSSSCLFLRMKRCHYLNKNMKQMQDLKKCQASLMDTSSLISDCKFVTVAATATAVVWLFHVRNNYFCFASNSFDEGIFEILTFGNRIENFRENNGRSSVASRHALDALACNHQEHASESLAHQPNTSSIHNSDEVIQKTNTEDVLLEGSRSSRKHSDVNGEFLGRNFIEADSQLTPYYKENEGRRLAISEPLHETSHPQLNRKTLKDEDKRQQANRRLGLRFFSRLQRTSLEDLLPLDSGKDFSEYLSYYDQWLGAGRLKECIDLLENLQKVGSLDMDKVYHARFLEVCKSKKAVKEAFQFVNLIEKPTLSTFNMLLSVCAAAEHVRGAFEVFPMVRNAGFNADCKLYTTLVSCCAKCGKVDVMFKVFHEMINSGIEPSIHTYGALIDGCARTGQVAKAFGVYGIMRSKNVKPDRIIFNGLITACGRSGAVDRAFDVFSEMRAEPHPLDPDHITIGALLNACSQSGQFDRALEVYRMLNEYRIKGTPDVYTMAINACGQNGNLEIAAAIYNDMKEKGVRPDETLFSALIDVAGHAEKVEVCFRYLEDAKRQGIKPGSIIYSALMGACTNSKNWQRALELYGEIKSQGVKPTVSTFNALITALCDAGKLHESVEFLEEMKLEEVLPNSITYKVLLMACEREDEPQLAVKLFSSAMTDGIMPDLTICNCILGLCLRRFQQDSACGQSLVRDETGNTQIHNQWTSWALLTYRQLISARVKPTKETLSQLLGCLRMPVSVIEEGGNNKRYHKQSKYPPLTEGFGVYDPRAFSLYEEAASLGIVPPFYSRDVVVSIDVRNMEVFIAEVYLLTVIKGVKHRLAGGAEAPNITIRLPIEEITVKSSNGEKLINACGRTGQAVAALLRRLDLPYQGKEAQGRIRISGKPLRQWMSPKHYPNNFHFHGRASTSRNPSVLLGKHILDQRGKIQTKDFSVDETTDSLIKKNLSQEEHEGLRNE